MTPAACDLAARSNQLGHLLFGVRAQEAGEWVSSRGWRSTPRDLPDALAGTAFGADAWDLSVRSLSRVCGIGMTAWVQLSQGSNQCAKQIRITDPGYDLEKMSDAW